VLLVVEEKATERLSPSESAARSLHAPASLPLVAEVAVDETIDPTREPLLACRSRGASPGEVVASPLPGSVVLLLGVDTRRIERGKAGEAVEAVKSSPQASAGGNSIYARKATEGPVELVGWRGHCEQDWGLGAL